MVNGIHNADDADSQIGKGQRACEVTTFVFRCLHDLAPP